MISKKKQKKIINATIVSLLTLALYINTCTSYAMRFDMAINDQKSVEDEISTNDMNYENAQTTSGISRQIIDMNKSIKETTADIVYNETNVVAQPLSEIEEEFEDYQMWVSVGWLNVRSSPDKSSDDNIVGHLNPCDVVWVIGEAEDEFLKIDYTETDDGFGYISSEYLQNVIAEEDTYNYEWDGKVLDRHNGKVSGPSGNETYYNLNMAKVVYYMNCLGYYGETWVREDGVKMFGNYIMVAADLSIRPKGSLVETTLGTGIVVDTGDFVNWDSTRLDIATTW